MHKAYAATQDRGRLVFALVLAAVLAAGWSNSASTGPRTLLRLGSAPQAFGLNGSRLAWIGDRIVVADLASGKRIRLVRSRTDYEEPVAVAGSTVVWLESVGGNLITDTLRAASPGHHIRYGRWGDDDYYLGSGPRFGGVAAEGETLVYGLYELTSLEQKSDRCYSQGVCHWRVTGGGTFLVSPGSLKRRRILPPSSAVAVDGKSVAAATLRRGARFRNKEQVVLLNSDGSRRPIGKPLDVAQLVLHRDRLAAVAVNRSGTPSVRLWDTKTGAPIRTLRLPPTTKLDHFGWARGRLVFRAGPREPGAVMSIDLRSGRRTVVAWIRSDNDYGPWVWRGRAIWVEQRSRGVSGDYTLVRSAPLGE